MKCQAEYSHAEIVNDAAMVTLIECVQEAGHDKTDWDGTEFVPGTPHVTTLPNGALVKWFSRTWAGHTPEAAAEASRRNQAARDRRQAEIDAKLARWNPLIEASLQVHQTHARAMLDLHAPIASGERYTCAVCIVETDNDDWRDCWHEAAEYPCETVRLTLETCGIDVTALEPA